ncbi:hypothetical protein GTA08_BOTSDO08862 [Botryosphaeria dothidea]|uniref:Uncharacterized protein n=1 Tax=Botryosphaeria dothidea TaxID=55169 RepID=A0A8H4ILR0_9PEZI|nr:hypothetical protein GTA08_BOTSDO08862 [Botryosphaeria dothidea]
MLRDVPSYDFVREVANLGPSIFPIVFAAVVAKNLRTVSLWQLERGQKVGVLDQLLGSTSVISTVITQVQLRGYGLATLRILDTKHQVDNTSTSVNYPTMNYTAAFDPGYASDSYALSSKTTFFTAAIMSPASVKNSSIDLWGNVKVPFLEKLLDSTEDPSSWINVSPNASYSSLIGVPLGNIPLVSSASTYVEFNTSYWTVECQNITTRTRFTALRDNELWFGPPKDEFPGATSLIATGKQPGTRRRLLYESRTGNCSEGDQGCILHAECTYDISFLEVGVNCIEDSFQVLHVRNATDVSRALHDTRTNLVGENLWLFAKFFTTAFNSPNPLSNLQYYLQDPISPWSPDNGTAPINTDVKLDDFALRLSQLMNSLWASLIMDYLLPVGRVPDLGDYTDQIGNRTAEIASRSGTVQASYQALRCHFGWLVVVFLASLVIFAVSLAGIVLSFMTTVPDLFMNASTMVRLSPSPHMAPANWEVLA